MPGRKLLLFFTIFASLLISVGATAGVSQSDDWATLEESMKSGKIYFKFPQYDMGSGIFLKATEVCLATDKAANTVIEPIAPKFRMKCIRRHGGKCQREIKVFPKKNVKGHRYGCMVRKEEHDPRSQCLMWGMVPYEVQTTFKIRVIQIEGEITVPLFEKELSLPVCKDVQ